MESCRKLFFLLFCLATTTGFAQIKVVKVLTENRGNPLGIDNRNPAFTWIMESKEMNTSQTAYEIEVGASINKSQEIKNSIWSSGKINASNSTHILYEGKPLHSGEKYYWRVRVWDNHGRVSPWSNVGFWQMGLLDTSDWKAQWIEPGYRENALRSSPLMRKEFESDKKIRSATAFITAHGLYEAQINGKKVGNAFFTPGFTSYNKRLQYQVYDVTNLINKGKNAIGVTLGNGWYRGDFSFHSRDLYGKDIALLFQLDIVYTDGSKQQIVSDGSWKSSTGEIRYSEIYKGEMMDARLAKTGWTLPDFDDKKWSGVKIEGAAKNTLIATYNQPVTKHETFHPIKIIKTPKGEHVLDFGQNLTGWVVLKVKGNAGDTIKISHAEVLDKKGNFYTANLRGAEATDIYILKGNGEEIFEPHFTWHGFRYARVEGYPGELKPENFEAVALYSDMPQTGHFVTSDSLVNQLQHNIEWSQKGNFLDVPTDCPQRDERLGWTGDAQVFFRTASFLRDINNFFTKWMKDVAADQREDGAIPHVIPNTIGNHGWAAGGSAGWADVATIIPWEMYQAYGDKRILENQYESMKRWVNYIQSQSHHDLWNTGAHFGDWLFYHPADDNDGRAAVTDKYLIAQCFYAHSTQLLINAAKVLNKTDDVSYYNNLLSKIKSAFNREYVTPSGRLVSGTQTAYVLALKFGMLPDSLRAQAAERLVDNIKSYGNHLTTGFLGTPYISEVLTQYGYDGVAYALLLQKTYPSWLYPVTKGATTIWERWDGIKPNGDFETPEMNSFNHYAYGAIGDWMYRKVAGIDTYDDEPGYKHIKIMPYVNSDLDSVNASLQTYYGVISSGWKIGNHRLLMNVSIPVNTHADIFIPVSSEQNIKLNGLEIQSDKDITVIGVKDGYMHVTAGSGNYSFEAPYAPANKNSFNKKDK